MSRQADLEVPEEVRPAALHAIDLVVPFGARTESGMNESQDRLSSVARDGPIDQQARFGRPVWPGLRGIGEAHMVLGIPHLDRRGPEVRTVPRHLDDATDALPGLHKGCEPIGHRRAIGERMPHVGGRGVDTGFEHDCAEWSNHSVAPWSA
jgi:hypothetical protein